MYDIFETIEYNYQNSQSYHNIICHTYSIYVTNLSHQLSVDMCDKSVGCYRDAQQKEDA
jgi:hypothetical protein